MLVLTLAIKALTAGTTRATIAIKFIVEQNAEGEVLVFCSAAGRLFKWHRLLHEALRKHSNFVPALDDRLLKKRLNAMLCKVPMMQIRELSAVLV
jgi:hypothetical protein